MVLHSHLRARHGSHFFAAARARFGMRKILLPLLQSPQPFRKRSVAAYCLVIFLLAATRHNAAFYGIIYFTLNLHVCFL